MLTSILLVSTLQKKVEEVPEWSPNKQNLTFSELLERLKKNTTWSNKIQDFKPTMFKKDNPQLTKINQEWLKDPIEYRKKLDQIVVDPDKKLDKTFIPSNSNSTDPMLRLNGYLRMNCDFKKTKGLCTITDIKEDPQHPSLNIVEFKFKSDDNDDYEQKIYQMQHRYRNPYKHWVQEQDLQIDNDLVCTKLEKQSGDDNGILKSIINDYYSLKISEEQDPLKLIQQAEKAMKKSLFHSPDPLEAQILYQDAAKIYTSMRNEFKASDCYLQAAKCAKQTDQDLTVAVLYRQAMDCLLRLKEKDEQKIKNIAQDSIQYFQRAGKFIDSARIYLQLSNIVTSPEDKKQYLQDAVDIFIQENKPSQASTALFETFCQCIKQQQYELLGVYSEQLYQLYKKLNYDYKIDQMRLSIIIVSLSRGDVVTAEQQQNLFENYNSDEYQMADDLINGYKNNDNERFQKGLENYGGKLGLPNEVLSILKTLQIESIE